MVTNPHAPLARALASVCAVAVTPLTSTGEVDVPSISSLAQHIVAEGAQTITVGGSVGEFMSLTANERQTVLASTVEAVAGRVPVIGAIGGDLPAAISEGTAAFAAGAAALMVHQPLNPFRSPQGWLTYHQQLARELAPVPIVIYLRDPAITATELQALADSAANVIAVKYALPDPIGLAGLTQRLGHRLVWICGLAESWAPFAWLAGTTGFTSGLANINGRLPTAMLQAMRDGDRATLMRLWDRIRPFEQLRARRGGAASVGVVKTALLHHNVIAHNAVRPPLEPLAEPEVSEVARIVDALDRDDVASSGLAG